MHRRAAAPGRDLDLARDRRPNGCLALPLDRRAGACVQTLLARQHGRSPVLGPSHLAGILATAVDTIFANLLQMVPRMLN